MMENLFCTQCSASNSVTSRYCSNCGFELDRPVRKTVAEPEIQKTKTSFNAKLILKIVAGVLSFFAAYFLVQKLLFGGNSLDRELAACASEINKMCPMMVDADTRLDNTVALPGNIVQYRYTLVNLRRSEIDTADIKNYLMPVMINLIKTNPQMKYFRERKTTMQYSYNDRNGVYVFMVSIPSSLYD